MEKLSHLSWDNFRKTKCVPGEQRIHRVCSNPVVDIYADGIQNRIGILLESDGIIIVPEEIQKLAFVSVQVINRERKTFLEISNSASVLQRQFYYFATAISERIVIDGKVAIDALKLELQCFEELLREISVLSIERQIGLLGELIILERLMAKNGIQAFDAWIGPTGEPHDFRIEKNEFEVKTTLKPHRVHTIHGAEQLVPSDGFTLHLISILLGPPGSGAGISLADKVNSIKTTLKQDAPRLDRFAALLESVGYRDAHCHHYNRKFTARRPLAIVTIDNSFPALSRPAIQQALGPGSVRIESVEYDINVEGLVSEEGQHKFSQILSV